MSMSSPELLLAYSSIQLPEHRFHRCIKRGHRVTLPFQTMAVTQSACQVAVVNTTTSSYYHIIISRPTNCMSHTLRVIFKGLLYLPPVCQPGHSNNQ